MSHARRKWSAEILRSRSDRKLQLESLEPRLLLTGDTHLINFQFDEVSTPNSYVRDVGALYGDQGNGLFHGWSTDHTGASAARGIETDQRLDTLIQFHQGETWELGLPSGLYEVTVVVGDPGSNDGVHTLNVEGINYWNAVADTSSPLSQTMLVTVSDGRLTLDSGAAAELATRINYLHVVGLPNGTNASPATPTITEPAIDGQEVSPADVHMEAVGFSDPEGDLHLSSDWEIWTVGPGEERVWFALGNTGVERLHTHLGDGYFENTHAGRLDLLPDTDFQLRISFRDDAGSVSGYGSRLFQTGAALTIYPLEIEDIATAPAPTWLDLTGATVELPALQSSILSPGDAIIAIDTSGNSSYPAGEAPTNATDGTLAKYLNFGEINSGLIVTPVLGSSVVESFRITTANDAEERDPTSWQLYGTNDTITSTDNSTGMAEHWTLIGAGSVALPAARLAQGPLVTLNNSVAYTSYRVIFTGVKNSLAANSMQIAEIEFFSQASATSLLLSPGSPIIAIDTGGNSSYPTGEAPSNAIDATAAKYLNHGEINSGFIVTPPSTASIVQYFQITAANDAQERDPTSWQLYGTNDTITSTDNSTGTAENWSLIDSGTVALPAARNTLGPMVVVSNNTTAYSSYRMIFTDVKNSGAANSMQIAEIQFYGDSGLPPAAPSLRVESGAAEELLSIEGSELTGNLVTNPAPLSSHEDVRVVISGGSIGFSSDPTNLVFTDEDSQQRTIFLPSIHVAAGAELILWVAVDGSTYFGLPGQTEPDFSSLARLSELAIPFLATQPGYIVEEVAGGFQLPVNIAFVPDPGSNPGDPSFYVNELYGTIKVVTNDGTVSDYATGLLNFNPTGNFPGSGEQGLAGLVVDPATGDLFVTRVTDTDGSPGGDHHPQVVRFTSSDGGLTAATETVILDMIGETQGQSHQISNISIGPDEKLYVHNGDGFDASTALNLNSYRGKILRVNLDGSAPTDNLFYDAVGGINARDYIYAYGFRNPFGGAWRASDGVHYEVENGPSVDRFARVVEGGNYQWDGNNNSILTNSIYNWIPSHAPVNITFVQQETFDGSLLPAQLQDHVFVSESGPTYAPGPQTLGKRIVEFELDAAGNVVGGPTSLVEYVGLGRATVVGLTAGPDGLYFTDLYKDLDAVTPIDPGARVLRVRYVGGITADFDIDGDVDGGDLGRWETGFGTTAGATIADGDADGDGDVDGADFLSWQTNYSGPQALGAAVEASQGESALPITSGTGARVTVAASVAPLAITESFVVDHAAANSALRSVVLSLNDFAIGNAASQVSRLDSFESIFNVINHRNFEFAATDNRILKHRTAAHTFANYEAGHGNPLALLPSGPLAENDIISGGEVFGDAGHFFGRSDIGGIDFDEVFAAWT